MARAWPPRTVRVMTTSQLPNADAAWLHMDSHLNPMVVNAVIWFDEPIDLSRAREIVEQRLVDEFPRFRQRVGEPLRPAAPVRGRPRVRRRPASAPARPARAR